MQLLTQKIRAALPPLGATDDMKLAEIFAQVKFFTPDAGWTWYAAEFDGTDVFWGLVQGFELEYGAFSLSELREIRGGLGLPVERDRYFEPRPLAELYAEHERGRR